VKLVTLTITLLIGTPLFAQQRNSAEPLSFEVASVKQAVIPDDVLPRLLSGGGMCGLPLVQRTGSRVLIPFSPSCGLIRVAYDVADYQVVGMPADLTKGDASNFFEVDARAAGKTTPSMDDARAMLRALLADRFLLKAHREPRDARIYALTVAKGGPKMTPCSNPNAASIFSPGLLLSCTPPMPIARIAQLLSREAGRPVVDKTGLTGTLTFELRWLPEGAPSQLDSPPALFTAIQEQLGLKLEPQRGPIDTIVVDSVERPGPN
jgi:uncharacterized protein (TIGR03435 family)